MTELLWLISMGVSYAALVFLFTFCAAYIGTNRGYEAATRDLKDESQEELK